MTITKDIRYVGVNDHQIDLFEGQYVVPGGMAYNSYVILDEKIAVIHAQSKFSSAGVPRLGIPTLWTSDGPHGVRAEVLWDKWSQAKWTNDSCVAFPALTCLAASWDRELAARPCDR